MQLQVIRARILSLKHSYYYSVYIILYILFCSKKGDAPALLSSDITNQCFNISDRPYWQQIHSKNDTVLYTIHSSAYKLVRNSKQVFVHAADNTMYKNNAVYKSYVLENEGCTFGYYVHCFRRQKTSVYILLLLLI
jgi:hypothetical protein